MPLISRETTEQILAATDIVDVIASYIPVKRAGAVFGALCPFHNEKTPSFRINPQRQFFHCFGCGKSGDAITFVREYENLTFSDAVRKLATRAGIAVVEEVADPKEDKVRRQRGRQLDIHREIAGFLHRMLFTREATHARDYMKSRGFGKEMAERWTVGWAPERGSVFLDWAREMKFTGRELVDAGFLKIGDHGPYAFFRDRLMFPMRNDVGDVIAFSGRKLREEQGGGKYVNSPETVLFKKSNVLFAMEKARREIMQQGSVLICEGQLDVICCHEQGISHAVACQGTALTENHAKMLRRYAKSAVLCYDADRAGMDATEKGYRVLAQEGIPVRVVKMPVGEDPDSYMRKNGPDAFRESLAKAVDFFDFIIERAASENRLSDLQQRSAFAKECANLLAITPDAVAREGMINHVATRLRIGMPELRDAVLNAIRFAKNKPAVRNNNPNAEPEAEKVEAAAIDPVVAYLCSLALHSTPAQECLGENFETLHEAADHLEGIPLLEAILSARPDAASHAAVNSFVASLPEAQRLALLADPTFHADPPEDPVTAAVQALAELSAKVLHRRDERVKAQIGRPDLTPEETVRLLHEIKEIANLLKGIDQRFVFNDRFAPSRKPAKPPFQPRNRSFSKPENNP